MSHVILVQESMQSAYLKSRDWQAASQGFKDIHKGHVLRTLRVRSSFATHMN